MDKPTSFSQNNLFTGCQYNWYLKYVKKIPAIQDMCYAFAGNVIHKCLELYYKNEVTNLEDLKIRFSNMWEGKYLNQSILKMKKDSYWLMIVEGINLKLPNITTTEMKIFYPDVVGFIDIMSSKDDFLGDWKSSTRSKINEEEYVKQLQFYSYLYKRKFGKLPSKTVVYYLKYTGSKQTLEYKPNEEDIKDIELWHLKCREEMKQIIDGQLKPIKCINEGRECNFFCPYKNLCLESGEDVLKFNLRIIGNNIFLDGPISDLLNRGLHKKFSYELKDAYYIKKAKPYANTTIDFWNDRKRVLPLAMKDALVKTLTDYSKWKKLEIAIDIDDQRVFDKTTIKMPEEFINGKKLRDYQTDAVDVFLRNKIGILEIGTGGGKTIIATEIIRRLGVKTLFIVDKIELLKQTKKVISECLGVEVGQIGQGVVDIKDITVATVQTLNKKIKDFSEYLNSVRFCVFDETHKTAAKSYIKISRKLINSEYRLGMSGTAFRDDGNNMMINAVVGYKKVDLSSQVLIEQGWLQKPNIFFIKDYMNSDKIKELEETTKTGLINETPNYKTFYDAFIVKNDDRNNVIYNLCDKHNDKKILILTKLIEHGKTLNENIHNSKFLHGSSSKGDRSKMFKDFTEGDSNILIATISIFAEGIDIPTLDIVINAAANKGNVKTIQVLGRVLRKIEGKKEAKYFDFIDDSDFFRGASLSRKKILIKEGHDVEVIKNENKS